MAMVKEPEIKCKMKKLTLSLRTSTRKISYDLPYDIINFQL